MNQFYREKPFFISALAPLFIAYGIIGIFASMGKSDAATGMQNLLNHITALDTYREKRVMMFISIMRTVGGVGLWQLKYWGAGIVIGICGFSLYLESQQSVPNKFALSIWVGLMVIVAAHYRDYD